MNKTFKNNKLEARFRFGDQMHSGPSRLKICMHISIDCFINILGALVDVEVPFLLRLNLFLIWKSCCTLTNMLLRQNAVGRWLCWYINLAMSFWVTPSILYPKGKLKNFHRHLIYQKPYRMFAVQEQASPNLIFPEVFLDLLNIHSTREVLPARADAPIVLVFRFQTWIAFLKKRYRWVSWV